MRRSIVRERILEALTANPTRLLTSQELADYVYRDREDGGPINADITVRGAIYELRHRPGKEKLPYRITRKYGYCLETVRRA